MRRIKMIGLCVVAACAFAALAGASTASAASFNVCVPAKHGNYADAACSKLAEKKGAPAPGKGKFEKAAVGSCIPQKHGEWKDAACTVHGEKKGVPVAGKGKFEIVKAPGPATVAGGAAELKSAAGAITCTSSTGTEQITGAKTITASTLFKGCETKKQKCENVGAGEIATFQLHGVLVEPTPGKASINLTGEGKGSPGPNEGKYLAEFACVGVAAVRVYAGTGPLGGKITPVNTFSTTHTTAFEEKVEQGLVADFGPPGFGVGTESFPSEQIGSVTATSASVDVSAP